MGGITVQEGSLRVKSGLGKPVELDPAHLRLAYLVTTQNLKWFVTVSKWDMLAVDLDDPDLSEAVELVDQAYQAEKPRALSSINICLADYEGRRIVVGLDRFKKHDVNIFALLQQSRQRRVEHREKWLQTNPSVTLGRATLDRERFTISPRKSIEWDRVASVQLDTQESLVSVVHLLVIPEGVGTGVFSLKKYKYSLKRIPKKLADLYLAECLFWMNLRQHAKIENREKSALDELIRDGIVTSDSAEPRDGCSEEYSPC